MGEEIRNPKMAGTDFWDCRPQIGKCPIGCNQCFYNRDGAFYSDPNVPYIPDPDQVGDGLVRLNCGHDSNLQRENVIHFAQKYKRYFFNTSIPKFNFPGPVVFTANAREEEPAWAPRNCIGGCRVRCISPDQEQYLDRLMFVRLRVSPTNLNLVEDAVTEWTIQSVPVVLTFMAYYDQTPPGTTKVNDTECIWSIPERVSQETGPVMKTIAAYTWKVRHINSYFCPTKEFMLYVLHRMKEMGGKLVTMCSTVDSSYCRDCMNCHTYYVQTMKHLAECPPRPAV